MNDDQLQQPPKTLEKLNQHLDKHDNQFVQVGTRFDAIDKKLAEHDKRFDQQDKTIEKLYVHMERRFGEMDARFSGLDSKIDRLFALLDEDLKRREIDEHERLAITHQADQHEDWIERASTKLNIKYDRAA